MKRFSTKWLAGFGFIAAASFWLGHDRPHLGDRRAAATVGGGNGERLESPGSPPAPFTGELSASDLSILVPLQGSPVLTASTSVFGRTGTGFCHAPTLDLGGDDPLMSREQWQDWAKDVLLSVLPLPPSALSWDGDIPPFAPLLQTAAALPDVDTPVDCPDPVAGDQLVQDTDVLRQEATNVATQQSLPRGACRYQNWRIVSARLDLCPFRASALSAEPNAFTPSAQPHFPDASCGGTELRLVAQPFTVDAQGYHALDMALHLFYRLPDAAQAVAAARTFAGISRASLAGKSAAGNAALWSGASPSMLLPHPGLREEMDCGGHPLGDGGDEALGPVGVAWQQFLQTQAKASRLVKMSWMVSDNSGSNWSFGLRVLEPTATLDRRVHRLEPFKVETFSAGAMLSGFPYSPLSPELSSVDYFYRAGRGDRSLTSPEAQSAVRELLALADPDKTSFNLGTKLGASCASCHTRDALERDLRTRSGLTHAQLAAAANVPPDAVSSLPIWAPFRAAAEERNSNNLRQFGYGPAMTFGVSRRSLAEAEALRQLVLDYFPGASPSPALGAQWQGSDHLTTGSSRGQVSQLIPKSGVHLATVHGVPDWLTTIEPLLALRCGYCHGFKRAPPLEQKAPATAMACYVDSLVQGPALGNKHMPPGLDLPPAEKLLIHAWASGQSCANPGGSP